LVLLARYCGGGLTALFACHVLSRAVFFGLCFLLGRGSFRPSIRGVHAGDVREGLRASASIGVIGLLVVVYETLDVVLLGKLANISELAWYSGAQRLVWPMLMALSSVGGTLYPVLSSLWVHAKERFDDTLQGGVDAVCILSGLGACSVLGGAAFYMGLLGPDMPAGSHVLQVLSILCCVKALTATFGPVLYVVNGQRYALRFIAVALVVKVMVLTLLAPRFGALGVALGSLGVEICFAAVPSVVLVRRLAQFRPHFTTAAKAGAVTLFASAVAWAADPHGGWAGAVLAPTVYVPLVFALGAVRREEVLSLLRWKTP
jgi:O-antigen/teichoic acid export membrane protein